MKAFVILTVVIVPFLAGECRGTARSPSQSGTMTLVILPFENNSITDVSRFDPLSKGLSAMLITDLSNSRTTLKVIEREKIQAILKEIALSQSGAVDESTAIEAGKILGAQTIAIGSFMVLAKKVRIDTRIIRVETGEVVMAESIMGESDRFLELEQELAKKIADSFRVDIEEKKSASKGPISAALYFSQGLEAWDLGNKAEANRLFRKCIKVDPAYRKQINRVKGET
jgi:TolB-like protein